MTDKELFLGLGERLKKTHTKAEMHEWVECLYTERKGSSQMQKIFSPSENVVISLYPQFKQDYLVLVDKGYMQKDGDYLQWLKSKKSLAEYFGYCKSIDGKSHWKEIELLFCQNKLYQSFQNAQLINQSIDYKNLKKILSK